MRKTLSIVCMIFIISCTKQDPSAQPSGNTTGGTTGSTTGNNQPVTGRVKYGGSSSCDGQYYMGQSIQSFKWTFSGVYGGQSISTSGALENINEGILNYTVKWSCGSSSSGNNGEKSGQVQVVAGQTAYINVTF